MSKNILVTGSAGFIGYHLCDLLCKQGYHVLGIDGFTNYYDVTLKQKRHALLKNYPNFIEHIAMVEQYDTIKHIADQFQPSIIIHLAAQAGVRYSLENPQSYISTNILGTFTIMEIARAHKISHLLLASTSSVYGANNVYPFQETHQADTPLTIYASTKKSTELLTHSYAHLWNIPTTCFRFFTVYGPYGRPDMALYKFVKNILHQQPIDIYNHGKMSRDFTYVTDLVQAINLLKDAIPETNKKIADYDSISPVAPFRIVNVGGGTNITLEEFIEAIEHKLGCKAHRHYMTLQTGDVIHTQSDVRLLKKLIGFIPQTPYQKGISAFIDWYREYYNE